MKIYAHTIVNNEENFIWFSLMSVADFVDKIIVYDTGSTDKTVEIIKDVIRKKDNKLLFKQVGSADDKRFSELRQKMLNESSDCDWIIILDGDEVWTKKGITDLVNIICDKGKRLNAIVVPFYNLIGDIYHHQEEKFGKYTLLDKEGFLTIRAINRKIKGLHVEDDYPKEGYYDGNGVAIQNLDQKTLLLLDEPYFHFTHLKRSSRGQRKNKLKYGLGKKFHNRIKYPEVFYLDYPKIINNPWGKRSKKFKYISKVKELARRII
jgi:glycosyltransferase involved in cell wall biosynthesis